MLEGVNIAYLRILGGGGQAFHFGKNYFELEVGGEGKARLDILKVFLGT